MEATKIYETKLLVGDNELHLSTGKLAKQAGGAVLVRYGDSVVLVAATRSKEEREIGYFPLTVDFEEKMYAAGKIPGGFIKREGRPSDHAIVSARLVDRSIRPLFPKGLKNDIQVVCLALSSDMENPVDVCGLIGASAALGISDIPFDGPIGGVRVARIEGKFILNPTFEQQCKSELNLMVAGTRDAILMVEGDGKEVGEALFLEALDVARDAIAKIVDAQLDMIEKMGKPKFEFVKHEPDAELVAKVDAFARPKIVEALDGKMKEEREKAVAAIKNDAVAQYAVKAPATDPPQTDAAAAKDVVATIEDIEKNLMRQAISKRGVRADGRALDEIRPISCEVGLLPRTHGSALFTRGQTQVLSTVTLGTIRDSQRIDGISEDVEKQYIHQYNFPPFSVGETRMMRGPSRRDIGHGMLAERAVAGTIPDQESFPYAIRVVSEVMESNGSSSMASVCGSSMALMDAGVPTKSAVAGIAMGLIVEDGGAHILTDIQGLEDHLGDMDFKVAGTRKGITAVQMDIKVKGITRAIMETAMEKARVARLTILEKMEKAIPRNRAELSPYAPRFYVVKIDVEKIGTIIGPGGKTIRKIQEETDTQIDIEEDGRVYIYSKDPVKGERAKALVESLVAEVEVGTIYEGIVRRIVNFGAFVEVLPNVEGLVHISQIANTRIAKVEDVLNVGDKVKVKVREIDDQGRVNLTMKGLD
jgi:polyribonucleotide nucleotidyltransferase